MLVVVLVTVGWVIVAGLFTFSPGMASDFPAHACCLTIVAGRAREAYSAYPGVVAIRTSNR